MRSCQRNSFCCVLIIFSIICIQSAWSSVVDVKFLTSIYSIHIFALTNPQFRVEANIEYIHARWGCALASEYKMPVVSFGYDREFGCTALVVAKTALAAKLCRVTLRYCGGHVSCWLDEPKSLLNVILCCKLNNVMRDTSVVQWPLSSFVDAFEFYTTLLLRHSKANTATRMFSFVLHNHGSFCKCCKTLFKSSPKWCKMTYCALLCHCQWQIFYCLC